MDNWNKYKKTAMRNSYPLIIVIAVFAISALFSLQQLSESIKLLENRHTHLARSLYELKVELRRFSDLLIIFEHGGSDSQNIKTRYDILWSRFPILLEGDDAKELSRVPSAVATIKAIFNKIQSFEPVITTLTDNFIGLTSIKADLESALSDLNIFLLDNLKLNNEYYKYSDSHITQLQRKLVYLMLGLIISGVILFLMVVRENRKSHYQAYHDSLTGLPNRYYLTKFLEQSVKKSIPFALHLIDLNGFKDINDSLGHHAGDQLLKKIAKRITQIKNYDQEFFIARLGGDEFAVVSLNLKDKSSASKFAKALVKIFDQPFKVQEYVCFADAGIGTVLYPEHGRDPKTLLGRADLAMYESKKETQESEYNFFRWELHEKLIRRQKIHHDLRMAIQKDELYINYQPIVNLKSDSIQSMEALLRWNHPELGLISPNEIIKVADQYGLGFRVGEWVINEVCQQLRKWRQQKLSIVPISINVSPSLYRSDLVKVIENALAAANLSTKYITLELTEDNALKMIKESYNIINYLRKIGIYIALDDFGTGLSSLSYLKSLSIQTLKIDRSFLKYVCEKPTDAKLLRNIIKIGHNLGMTVVAEGVEDNKVANLLRKFGCDLGQGYLFYRPSSKDKIQKILFNMTTNNTIEPLQAVTN